MQLSWADYLVIGGYLAAITAFGSWFARFQKTTRDYFLTDRSVPWWAVCFTIVATEPSTLTFIGIPAAAYAGNMTFLQLALGYVIGRLLVSVLFIPAYFRGDLFTSYELLQRRLGSRVKTLSAVIFLVTRSLADGIRLIGLRTGHLADRLPARGRERASGFIVDELRENAAIRAEDRETRPLGRARNLPANPAMAAQARLTLGRDAHRPAPGP